MRDADDHSSDEFFRLRFGVLCTISCTHFNVHALETAEY